MSGGARATLSSEAPPCATSAIRVPGRASQSTRGTLKIAPADARSARGAVGSAQSAERATAAPNASAVRSNVPTFPGSATRQSARTTSRSPTGRSFRLKTPMTRGAWPSVDTSPRSSGTTFSPAIRSSTGSTPAATAAPTRSSPSAAKSPVSTRCFFPARSFRTSRSFSFCRDSIRPRVPLQGMYPRPCRAKSKRGKDAGSAHIGHMGATEDAASRSFAADRTRRASLEGAPIRARRRAQPSHARRRRRRPAGRTPRCPRATCDRARSRPSSRPP